MHIVVHSSLTEIDAKSWNALVVDNNPFIRHEFLLGLEKTHCVSTQKGWESSHIAIYRDTSCNELIAAMPCYIKSHSYGEYIFDWAWADAHHRHGLEYYPKLSNAIPFTPATGQRMLIKAEDHTNAVEKALVERALKIVDERGLSSFHSLFCTASECQSYTHLELLERHSTQFHWQNNDYHTFDDFLTKMSSKKRKNIKRERRRVRESGVHYQWLSGDDLTIEAAHQMYRFYSRTIAYYGAQSYLNRDFFEYLSKSVKQNTLFLFAYYEEQIIAGGLYFKSDHTLYGRYWGALNNFHSVHFETCYYQAIEWCINNGYRHFEAGAQGEHKLARGLEPNTTYSAHWISHPQFRNAINDFLHSEQEHTEHYQNAMAMHSPFKVEV